MYLMSQWNKMPDTQQMQKRVAALSFASSKTAQEPALLPHVLLLHHPHLANPTHPSKPEL